MAVLRIDRQLTGAAFDQLQRELRGIQAAAQGVSGVNFTRLDRSTNGLVRSFNNVGRAVDGTNKSVQELNSTFAVFGSTVSTNFTRRVLRALVEGFADVVDAAAQFEDQLNRANVIAGGTAEELDLLSAAARDAAASTTATGRQVAELATQFARAGRSAGESAALFQSVAQAAEVADEELSTIGRIASASLNQFNLDAEDSARVLDLLTFSANSADQTITDLGGAFRFAGPVAGQQFNQSIEDTLDSLTGLADAGIRGSTAGTSLARALTDLFQPSTEARDLLERLGVEITDVNGEFRSQVDVINEVATALQGTSAEAQAAALSILAPSARGVRALAVLVEQSQRSTENFRDNLAESAGVVEEQFGQIIQTFQGSVSRFQSALDIAAINAGRIFTTILQPLVDVGTNILNLFNALPGPIQNTLSLITGLTTAVAILTAAIVTFQSFLGTAVGRQLQQNFSAIANGVRSFSDRIVQADELSRQLGITASQAFDLIDTGAVTAAGDVDRYVQAVREAGGVNLEDPFAAVRNGSELTVRRVSEFEELFRRLNREADLSGVERELDELRQAFSAVLEIIEANFRDTAGRLPRILSDAFADFRARLLPATTAADFLTNKFRLSLPSAINSASAALRELARLVEQLNLAEFSGLRGGLADIESQARDIGEVLRREFGILQDTVRQTGEIPLLPSAPDDLARLNAGIETTRALLSGLPAEVRLLPPALDEAGQAASEAAQRVETIDVAVKEVSASTQQVGTDFSEVSDEVQTARERVRPFSSAIARIDPQPLITLAAATRNFIAALRVGDAVTDTLSLIRSLVQALIRLPGALNTARIEFEELLGAVGPIGAALRGTESVLGSIPRAFQRLGDAVRGTVQAGANFRQRTEEIGEAAEELGDALQGVRPTGIENAIQNAADAVGQSQLAQNVREEVREVTDSFQQAAKNTQVLARAFVDSFVDNSTDAFQQAAGSTVVFARAFAEAFINNTAEAIEQASPAAIVQSAENLGDAVVTGIRDSVAVVTPVIEQASTALARIGDQSQLSAAQVNSLGPTLAQSITLFQALANNSSAVGRALQEGRVSLEGIQQASQRAASSFREFSAATEVEFPTLGRLASEDLQEIIRLLAEVEQEFQDITGAGGSPGDPTLIFLQTLGNLLLENEQRAEQLNQRLRGIDLDEELFQDVTLPRIRGEVLEQELEEALDFFAAEGQRVARELEQDLNEAVDIRDRLDQVRGELESLDDQPFLTGLETSIDDAGARLERLAREIERETVEFPVEVELANGEEIELRQEVDDAFDQPFEIDVQATDITPEVGQLTLFDDIDEVTTAFRQLDTVVETTSASVGQLNIDFRTGAEVIEDLGLSARQASAQLRDGVGSSIDQVSDRLTSANLNTRQFGNNFINLFTNRLPGSIQPFADSFGDLVLDNLATLADSDTEIFSFGAAFEEVGQQIRNIASNVTSALGAAGVGGILSGVTTAAGAFLNVLGPIALAVAAIGTVVVGVARGIGSFVQRLREGNDELSNLNSVLDAIGLVGRGLVELFNAVTGAIGGVTEAALTLVASGLGPFLTVLEAGLSVLTVVVEELSFLFGDLGTSGNRTRDILLQVAAATGALALALGTLQSVGLLTNASLTRFIILLGNAALAEVSLTSTKAALIAAYGALTVSVGSAVTAVNAFIASTVTAAGVATAGAAALVGLALAISTVRTRAAEAAATAQTEFADSLNQAFEDLRNGVGNTNETISEFGRELIAARDAGTITERQFQQISRQLVAVRNGTVDLRNETTILREEQQELVSEIEAGVEALRLQEAQASATAESLERLASVELQEAENALEIDRERLELTRERLSENDRQVAVLRQQAQDQENSLRNRREARTELNRLQQEEVETLREIQAEQIQLAQREVELELQRADLAAQSRTNEIDLARQSFEISQAERDLKIAELELQTQLSEASDEDKERALEQIADFERQVELANQIRDSFDERQAVSDRLLQAERDRILALQEINVERAQETAEAEILAAELDRLAAAELDRQEVLEEILSLVDETGESLVDSQQEAEALTDEVLETRRAFEETGNEIETALSSGEELRESLEATVGELDKASDSAGSLAENIRKGTLSAREVSEGIAELRNGLREIADEEISVGFSASTAAPGASTTTRSRGAAPDDPRLAEAQQELAEAIRSREEGLIVQASESQIERLRREVERVEEQLQAEQEVAVERERIAAEREERRVQQLRDRVISLAEQGRDFDITLSQLASTGFDTAQLEETATALRDVIREEARQALADSGTASSAEDIASQLGLDLEEAAAGINTIGGEIQSTLGSSSQGFIEFADGSRVQLDSIGDQAATTADDIASQLGVTLDESQQAFFGLGEQSEDSFNTASSGAEDTTRKLGDLDSAVAATVTTTQDLPTAFAATVAPAEQVAAATAQIGVNAAASLAQVQALAQGIGAAAAAASSTSGTTGGGAVAPSTMQPSAIGGGTTPPAPATTSLLGGLNDAFSSLGNDLKQIKNNTGQTNTIIGSDNRTSKSPDRSFKKT